MSSVILVTGGSGLVGKAIEWVIENDKSERYGKKEGEKWVFLNSKDGDLRQVFKMMRIMVTSVGFDADLSQDSDYKLISREIGILV
jgi:hypothetical protein